jgi:hypothetical protein
MMFVTVDEPVSEGVLARLGQVSGISDLHYVELSPPHDAAHG